MPLTGAGGRVEEPPRRDVYGWQVPFTQKLNGGHALAQPPQFEGSVKTSAHFPPQSLVSEPHKQVPPRQTLPPLHAWPHAPQLVGSVDTSAHSPLQNDCPAGHAHVPPA